MFPTEGDAAEIAAELTGAVVLEVTRFPLGLAHWVYEVLLADGNRVVARLATGSSVPVFAGAQHWNRALRGLGVPLPTLLHSGRRGGVEYLLLERLPGRDLGLVYGDLSPKAKREIATEVARIQATVATLGEGEGFGFVSHPSGAFPHASWVAVVLSLIERARVRLETARPVDPRVASALVRAVERHGEYLAAVRAIPFLDDTTTKNVLVDDGHLSGIVDVDWVCYGDPLFPVALTWVALTADGHDPDYVEYWCDALGVTAGQRRALALYRSLFCLDLLSEIGHRFNQTERIALDPARVERLASALEQSLSVL